MQLLPPNALRQKMSKLSDRLKKDFKSGHLSKIDLIILITHPIIGLLIWHSYHQDFFDKETLKDFSNVYLFLLPLLLVGLFFRKLRNIQFYLAWLLISIVHLLIYPMVYENPDFAFQRGTSFDGLVALLPTLIIFQLFRQIFFSLKEQEMIISVRQYRMTMYEEEDRRKMTWIEVIFSILLMLTATLSGIFLT